MRSEQMSDRYTMVGPGTPASGSVPMAATRAYVLVETAVGRARDIAAALRGIPGLVSVDVTTGPYDVIIVLEAGSLADVAELVTEHVHTIGGVVRTVTCLVMLENSNEAIRS